MSGTLYIVATPIGNLEDITLRALETLKQVGIIVCEDTRVTSKLLAHYGIEKPLRSIHAHTDDERLTHFVDQIKKGESMAYVSDAGTPGVNDPGGKFVQEAMRQQVPVVPIPGASALSVAISVCGFPMENFTYLGFIPHKKGRETLFKSIAAQETASVFFESTHRIEKTLEGLSKHLDPARQIFIGRELTKMHETLYRGTLAEVQAQLKATSIRGEFVVIIGHA